MRIHIDIESRSLCDLPAVGSYRYAEDPSTVPLCIGWAVEGSDPLLWWPGTPIPDVWRRADAVFVAHNVQFDRVFFDHQIFRTRADQWDDTMIRCRYYGLPAALEDVSSFLFGMHKDPRGEELVKATDGRGVCRLQKKGRGAKAYTFWNNDPKDLYDLGEYCRQDVRLLQKLDQTVGPLPAAERAFWLMNERMNDNGIPLDWDFVSAAISIVEHETEKAIAELVRVTDGVITTPGQLPRIIKFAEERGVDMPDCTADTVEEYLDRDGLPADVRTILNVRSLTNSAAVKKYAKAAQRLCKDGRIHGEMIAFGAHTLRNSSRGVQTQNGKRGKEKEYMPYRAAAVRRDPAMMTGWVDWNYFLSTAVRSMIRAPEGYTLVVYDYAGIESREVDYLVVDLDALEDARNGVDRYKILAGSIFNIEPTGVDKDKRSVGKEAKLSGQYGVGWRTYKKRLEKTWKVTTSDDRAKLAIKTFRRDNPKIADRNFGAWAQLERAWRSACAGVPGRACYCDFEVTNGWMVVTAPNGRSLYYYDPQGGKNLSYAVPGKMMTAERLVIDHETGQPVKQKQKVPLRKHVYGGLLLENISQWKTGMIARDDMTAIEKRFIEEHIDAQWLFMVHDESIALVRDDQVELVCCIVEEEMTRPVWWCRDLPIAVEGWTGEFYKKG